MKLGTYEFEWVPDEMDIPRPDKKVAVQGNLGNVGYFSWGPLLIGKEVKMKWKFVSAAQYAAFKAMYLAGGVHVLDLTPDTIFIPDPGGAPTFQQYPDPAHDGPTTRRFYIGPIFTGASWPMDGGVGIETIPDPLGPAWPANDYGTSVTINTADPAASYIEISGFESGPLPDFGVGFTIYEDTLVEAFATIVPWDPAIRPYYLYPSPSGKIYYSNVTGEVEGDHIPTTLEVGDVLWRFLWPPEDGKGVVITGKGSDANGTWFTCEAAPGKEAIVWTAGQIGWGTYGSYEKRFVIEPWNAIVGGSFGG